MGLLSAGFAWGAGDWRKDWATLQNARHGFLIAYPVEVFRPKSAPTTDEGRVLYSPDGKAQLLVGAFANDEQMTLRAYRDYLLEESYAGATIDYAPIRRTGSCCRVRSAIASSTSASALPAAGS